jgi:hypothetical protein
LPASLADYHWLTSDVAESFLRRAAEHVDEITRLVNSLRKDLSAERTHLVVEQVALRKRGLVKFARADEMFFTKKGLEQATDERIAAYKAQRFHTRRGPMFDICCGIGGDLLAFGASSATLVYGCDSDPVIAHVARQNCRRIVHDRVRVLTQSAEELIPTAEMSWHVDPDRRAEGRRATRIDLIAPRQEWIDTWRAVSPQGGVKLAPATEAPEAWTREAQLEWIGSRGECRQQMAWFGGARGRRCATIVDAPGGTRTVGQRAGATLDHTANVGRYVYEAHGAVLAAGLAASLAAEHALQALTAEGGYLTGDLPIVDGALAAFLVQDVLPFDRKQLKAYFRQHNIGQLEVKIRGLDGRPDPIRKGLDLRGDEAATLMLARAGNQALAIVARRP